MKTKSAKAKGRRLQDLVAKKILSQFPKLEGLVKPVIMGEGGVDVRMFGPAKDIVPYAIECKNSERWTLGSWWNQTTANAGEENLKPCLIISKNRMKQPLVVIELDEFLDLIKKRYPIDD